MIKLFLIGHKAKVVDINSLIIPARKDNICYCGILKGWHRSPPDELLN